jgi:3-hydroxy-D-aspartate aldolase
MTEHETIAELEVGYDIPAAIGMDEGDIQTPCLILDLDALERNVKKMGDFAKQMGVRHRVHGKMHKSVDVAMLQEKLGGSVGVCCQKVSEAKHSPGRRTYSSQTRCATRRDRPSRVSRTGQDYRLRRRHVAWPTSSGREEAWDRSVSWDRLRRRPLWVSTTPE